MKDFLAGIGFQSDWLEILGTTFMRHALIGGSLVAIAAGLLGDLHRERDVTIMVVAHDLNPLLPVLTEAIYLLDGHPHHDPITDVVQEELLTHLYGTPVGVVRTAQGDLFTRAAWRDPHA